MQSAYISRYSAPGWTGLVFALAGCVVLIFVSSNFSPHLSFHVALFIIGLLATSLLVPAEDRATIVAAYVAAYAIRGLTILLVHQLSPNGLLLLDDQGYDDAARALASDWSLANLQYASSDFGTTHTGYPIIIGWLYNALGVSVLSAKLLNAFFGALTVPLTYLLAMEVLGDSRASCTAAWVSAFFLYDVMWTGFLMKDTILLFLFTGAVLALCRLRWRTPIIPLALFLSFLWLLSYFRFYAIGVIAAAAAGATVTLWLLKYKGHTKTRVAIVCVLLVTAACAAAIYNYYSESIEILAGFATAVEQVDKSGYTFLHPALTLDFVMQFSKGCVVYMLGPFPWVFHGVDWIGMLFYPGMYITYIGLPFFLIGCVQLWNNKKWAGYLILFCFLFHALIEILIYQAGERQRMMTDSIFVIGAALGWYHRAGYRRFIPATYAVLAVFALAQIGASVL